MSSPPRSCSLAQSLSSSQPRASFISPEPPSMGFVSMSTWRAGESGMRDATNHPPVSCRHSRAVGPVRLGDSLRCHRRKPVSLRLWPHSCGTPSPLSFSAALLSFSNCTSYLCRTVTQGECFRCQRTGRTGLQDIWGVLVSPEQRGCCFRDLPGGLVPQACPHPACSQGPSFLRAPHVPAEGTLLLQGVVSITHPGEVGEGRQFWLGTRGGFPRLF